MRILIFLVGLSAMTSCSDEDFTTGGQFFNDISFEFTTWDTLSMKFSTIRFDSSITSNPEGLLIGQFTKPVFGQVNAFSYLQLISDSSAYELDNNSVHYDSITIVLDYNHYFLNDTTTAFTILIDELNEDLELNNETSNLYNISHFATKRDIYGDSALLGRKTFYPRPFTGDPIEITLSEELGQRLFAEALVTDNLYAYPADFLNFFKGIKISTDGDSETALGLEVSPLIKIYYTDLSTIPSEQKYIGLTNSSSGEIFFNQFEADYSGTVLEDITTANDNKLSSSLTNEEAYMQSGTGLSIRIELPYIKKIIEDNPDLLIDNAIIKLKPVKDQYATGQLLPKTLVMYYVDKHNSPITSETHALSLNLDDEFNINTYYTADITDFISYQLSQNENNENALLITTTEDGFSGSLDYISIGDQQNQEYKAQINLNLIHLKND